MAPKGRPAKRPAANTGPAPVAKKPAVARAPADKPVLVKPAAANLAVAKKPAAEDVPSKAGPSKSCMLVTKALDSVPDYSPEALEMLRNSLPQSLGVLKEERHSIQERVVEMIGEVLKKSEALLQDSLSSADEKFSTAQADKASKESEEADCTTNVADKAQAEEAAQAALQASQAALSAAQKALVQAEGEQKKGDAELEAAAGKLAALKETKEKAYDALKEGTAEKVKDSVQVLMKTGNEFSFDSSLLSALPSAVSKAPGDRSTFDGLVLQQAEAQFARCIGALEETIATGDAAKGERAEKVVSAMSDLEKAKEAEQASRDALKDAKVAKKEAEAAQKAAAKAKKEMEPALKKLAVELEKATAHLEDFRTGPLAAFQELAERTSPAPPPSAMEGVAPEAPAEPAAPVGETAAAE